MDISVIIPVYNNAGTLELLFNRLTKVLMAEPFTTSTKEIVLVNDGSHDSSVQVIRDYWKKNETGIEVRQINFTHNFGQVSAVLCGAKEAKGNCIATLSADLQDPPELIAEMFKGWQNGFLINLGYRKIRADGFLNRLFSRLFYYIIRKYYPQLPAGGFDYVLLDRKVINNLISIQYKNRFLQGDIINLGYSVKWYHYVRGLPASKANKTFNPFKINYFIDSIFHTKFLISFLFIESALIIFSGVLTIAWHFIAVDFNYFIIGLVILLFGIVNMSFAAVVAYLWRIYNEMKIYPDYIISNREDY